MFSSNHSKSFVAELNRHHGRLLWVLIVLSQASSPAQTFALSPSQPPQPEKATNAAADSSVPADSPDSAGSEHQSLPDLAAALKKSLVVVRATGRDGRDYGHGTGFVISADGLIATARHVIGDGRAVRVELSDGTLLPVTHIHAAAEALDVVVLRVLAKDLVPLKLGDSDAAVIGQAIVVAGHPKGLRDSFFSGILSGHHDIEDISMLQLAVTVEPGSSGEPVVDRQGRVLGIVTMKSTAASNIGFALPVTHLNSMLQDPVPIPIERWMTIGALDPAQWNILWGANWRQRASRLLVDGEGEAFGGRSLCLHNQTLPDLPYELQVDIKLDDETGAAGLAFHADGSDRHYGFYPSAGKPRLTRFSGPVLDTWTILHNEAHSAYRPGEWNTFRVRLEAGRFQCFVNGQLAVESTDSELPPGKVGLAVFRGTSAAFRRFQVATSIPSLSPDQEQQTAIASIMENVRPERPPTMEVVNQMQAYRQYAAHVLEQKARQLEEQSKRLRQLARDVHAASIRDQILTALGHSPSAVGAKITGNQTDQPTATALDGATSKIDPASPNLLRAALLIAALDNDEVEPGDYEARVDRLAAEVRARLPEQASEADRLHALDDLLFREYGFRGSRFDYYTKSNSYLNEVLDDREGLPITLSVVYMEIARRLDLKMTGLGLPGHFVVRFAPADGTEPQIIDVFNRGKRLTREQAETLIRDRGFPVRPDFFENQTTQQIVERMITNLLGLAEDERDDERVLRYLDVLTALNDQSVEYRAKRLEMRARTGRLQEAISDADWFIARDPENADRLAELRSNLQQSLELQGLSP